jgi:bifunctional non-homologous end joining protein LigD
VLEIHPWGTRVGRLERPDRLVLDIDPAPGLPWARVVEAAEEARALFKDLGLVSFVKTTGGKGLHVVVPVRPEAGWDALRALGEGIGAEMTRRAPERYTINPLKAARRGRIFIDYLRNVRGATAVAAYSPRAKPGAPVSTPLTWTELSAGVDPAAFTVTTVPKRLVTFRKDPWADFFSADQAITARTATARAPPRCHQILDGVAVHGPVLGAVDHPLAVRRTRHPRTPHAAPAVKYPRSPSLRARDGR